MMNGKQPVARPDAAAKVRWQQLEHDAERQAERVCADKKAPAAEPVGGSQRALTAQERAFYETRFGRDFSSVRLHADSRSAAAARALNAEAYTIGSDIFVDRGTALCPDLMAHELAHVAQQQRTGPAIQPKLKITGKADDVARAQALLNGGLGSFYYLSIDAKTGEVRMEPVRAAHTSSITGPAATQKALAERLHTIISDAKSVDMTVSAGSKTLIGEYATGDVDIADAEKWGVPIFIHEIEEQYQKQAKGVAYGSESSGAHSEAIKAESEVRGAQRGAQKIVSSSINADGTMDLVVELPHTFPDKSVKTMVITIKSNNITSVVWK